MRLLKGDFAAETVYSERSRRGARRAIARSARGAFTSSISTARATARRRTATLIAASLRDDAVVKLQVGGGLRTLERVATLLDAGVERAVIGSVAVTAPDDGRRLDVEQVDPTRIVLALDVRLDATRRPDAHDARLAADEQRRVCGRRRALPDARA